MNRTAALMMFALSLVGMTGCQSTFQKTKSLNPFDTSTVEPSPSAETVAEEVIEYKIPTSMAVVWVDSILTSPRSGPVRGFGGRIFFYDEDGVSVRVDGELKIYAFDDSNDLVSVKIPDRKYVFRQTELQTHYSESDLGPAYSFWIPWGAVNGPRMTVSLLPILTTAEGVTVRGEQSLNLLPGTEEEVMEEISSIDSRGRQVTTTGNSTTRDEGPINQSIINSTTIEVPPSLANQMRTPQTYHQRETARSQPYTSSGTTNNGFGNVNAQTQTSGSNLGMSNASMSANAMSNGSMSNSAMSQGAMSNGSGQGIQGPIPINQSGTGTPDFRLPPSVDLGEPIRYQPNTGQQQRQSTLGQGGYGQPGVYGQPGAIQSRRR